MKAKYFTPKAGEEKSLLQRLGSMIVPFEVIIHSENDDCTDARLPLSLQTQSRSDPKSGHTSLVSPKRPNIVKHSLAQLADITTSARANRIRDRDNEDNENVASSSNPSIIVDENTRAPEHIVHSQLSQSSASGAVQAERSPSLDLPDAEAVCPG